MIMESNQDFFRGSLGGWTNPFENKPKAILPRNLYYGFFDPKAIAVGEKFYIEP